MPPRIFLYHWKHKIHRTNEYNGRSVFLYTVCDLHVVIKPGIEISFWDIFGANCSFCNKWFLTDVLFAIGYLSNGAWKFAKLAEGKDGYLMVSSQTATGYIGKQSPRGQGHITNLAKSFFAHSTWWIQGCWVQWREKLFMDSTNMSWLRYVSGAVPCVKESVVKETNSIFTFMELQSDDRDRQQMVQKMWQKKVKCYERE